jgi:hypothetical protein
MANFQPPSTVLGLQARQILALAMPVLLTSWHQVLRM